MVGQSETIPTKHTAEESNVSSLFYWSKLYVGTQFLVLVSNDHVLVIPIKHCGNNLSHCDMYDILPILFEFCDNLSNSKKMSLYYEEAKR